MKVKMTVKHALPIEQMKILMNAKIKVGITQKSNIVIPGADADLAFIGAVNHNGSVTNNIPATPFIKKPVEDNVNNVYAEVFAKNADNLNASNICNQVGTSLVNKIRDDINTQGRGTYVPNKPATIKAKGGIDKRLIHTGRLLLSIDSEVIL